MKPNKPSTPPPDSPWRDIPPYPYGRYSDLTPPGESQKFIRNNKYFTICVYALVMISVSAIIFKAIIDFQTTKDWFHQVFNMLAPFLFGALLAYVLNPMVHMFYQLIQYLYDKAKARFRFKIGLKHSTHTVLSILITYLLVIGFATLTLLYVIPELIKNITDFVNYIPHLYAELLHSVDYLQERFPNVDVEAITKPLTDQLPALFKTIRDMAGSLVPAVYIVSMSIASWIVNVLITLIVSIYMLYDKRRLMHLCWRIIYAFVPEKKLPQLKEVLSECNRLFSSFVIGKAIDSVIIGLICFFLMTIFRMPYAPLISLIIGVTNMIPYFGPFIGAIPSFLILLFIKPLQALAFVIMILCLQQFDGLILGPKILGNSTGMKPLGIIFAITFGGYVAGVVGMFLGVPLVAFLGYLFDRYLTMRLNKRNIPEKRVEEAVDRFDLDD